MLFDQKRNPLPFGIATMVLVGAALIWQYAFNQADACQVIESRLKSSSSYFMSWNQPTLSLIRPGQPQIHIEADSKILACQKLASQLERAE